jgi:hypothetical protein
MKQGRIFGDLSLLDESLISLETAAQHFPVKVSKPTLERYLRQGKRGVRLESVLLVNRRFTTKEAVMRFIHRQLLPELDAD